MGAGEGSMEGGWRIELMGWLRAVRGDCVVQRFRSQKAGALFALFRSWHNERALDPSGPWSRLTLAIAYSTEVHLFITDLDQSPFNVGTRLTLDDFTLDQTAELNRPCGPPFTAH